MNVSVTRRHLLGIQEKDQCLTGNPIDNCWRFNPNWQTNPQSLGDCGIELSHDAMGGRGGQVFLVTKPYDNPKNPAPGTFRFAAIQQEPVWIFFSTDMVIKLKQGLLINSLKTINGQGSNVHITGTCCLFIHDVTNVIIHNVHIHHCVPSKGSASSDGDGISVMWSKKIRVDHCSLSYCKDGLIGAGEGSTGVTISNSYFSHHDKVMLLGHSNDFDGDRGMQVTVVFNHFGEECVEIMPRCRLGYFHTVNNDYSQWGEYVVGSSSNPTINSQGNHYNFMLFSLYATEERVHVLLSLRNESNTEQICGYPFFYARIIHGGAVEVIIGSYPMSERANRGYGLTTKGGKENLGISFSLHSLSDIKPHHHGNEETHVPKIGAMYSSVLERGKITDVYKQHKYETRLRIKNCGTMATVCFVIRKEISLKRFIWKILAPHHH